MSEKVESHFVGPDNEKHQALMDKTQWVSQQIMPAIHGWNEGGDILTLVQALCIFAGSLAGQLIAEGVIDGDDIEEMLTTAIVPNFRTAVDVGVARAGHVCEHCAEEKKRIIN